MRAAAGLGLIGRRMDSGLVDVAGYDSSPVASVRVDAEVRPIRRLALAAEIERTITLNSQLAGGPAPTSITHWQATAAYVLSRARFELAPTFGYGISAFIIDSDDADRPPDARIGYLLLGARVTAKLGRRLALFGFAAFEPSVTGPDYTEMDYGPESRWAIEVSGGLEVRAMKHVFVRARADYRRFTWNWSSSGIDGVAADRYSGGTLSVGAEY